jgi:hypothetical protein
MGGGDRVQGSTVSECRMTKLPIASTVLCASPQAHNPGSARGLAVRLRALLTHRRRRIVRLGFPLLHTRRVHRARPAWRTPQTAHCSLTECRMHLAEFYRVGKAPLGDACALIVAARGGHEHGQIADLLGGMSAENVAQIERKALARPAMQRLASQDGERPRERAALEERVLSALRVGERSLRELVKRVHADDLAIVAVLNAMVERGEAEMRWGARNVGRRWSLAAVRRAA